MAAPAFTHLDGRIPLERHEHMAVLYRARPQALRFASFLAEGFLRGDICFYLAPEEFHNPMLDRLRALGADCERALRSGTLQMEEGDRELKALRERAQKIFDDAERRRAPGIRWLEEGSWAQVRGFSPQGVSEFHALLNYQVKHYPSVALCQYSLDEIEPPQLFSAIAVHRHLLVEDALVRDNPFYIPAEKFLALGREERERDLTQLFREVGFDVQRLLAAIQGYGRLDSNPGGER